MPVAKHPRFGRYFWVLLAVAGRDLITSFDLRRAEDSSALTPQLIDASVNAIILKNIFTGFAPVVEPPLVS